VLDEHPDAGGVLRVALMLLLICWMYGGYAWLTNAVELDRLSRRLLLLGGTAGYLVLALAVPHAFAGAGLAFGLAYLAIVVVHVGLFTRASSTGVVHAILRVAPFNLAGAALVLLGGALGGNAEYAAFLAAVLIEYLSSLRTVGEGFEIGAAHFTERNGLVILIAIGESVVATGAGADGRSIDLSLVAVAVLGLALSACLWWAYFGADDAGAERALAAASPARRARLALTSFGYCQPALLLGIVAVASALNEATAHAFHELGTARALALAGGVAVYLAADVAFRLVLGTGPVRWRIAAAITAFATVPLGTSVDATAQIAAVVAVLLACFAAERRPGYTASQARRTSSTARA
jgi:low temperature requirement protein LtrA